MSSTLTTMPSASGLKVLSADSLNVLKVRGDDAELHDGFRAVSNSSYATADSLDFQATVLIPDELESKETLRFLELNESTSEAVWGEYLQRYEEFPERATVLNSAKRYITSTGVDCITENDDWVGTMRQLGMSSNYQARIMKDELKEMRLAGSLKEWVSEMMESRYEFLENLNSLVQSPPARNVAREVSRLDSDGKFKTKAGPSAPPRGSSQGQIDPAEGPVVASATSDPPATIDDHVVLYKGGSTIRLEKVRRPNGQLNFAALGSTPPRDFSKNFRGLYLTEHENVAWKYCEWARANIDGDVVPVGLLHVAVPNTLMASSYQIFGDDWKKLVWACRRDEENIPPELEYLEEFQWLIGGICHLGNKQVQKMQDLSELQVWKLDNNQTASQHYASNNTILRLLNMHCVGKVWITLVEAARADRSKKP